jgi:hypothetical protein
MARLIKKLIFDLGQANNHIKFAELLTTKFLRFSLRLCPKGLASRPSLREPLFKLFKRT